MQISELMKMIPDDGELTIKNNSGTVYVSVRLYDLYCEEMIKLHGVDDKIVDIIKSQVQKIKEKHWVKCK